jgi:diketogulonate reductase-like aldo/keto reductase
MDLNLQSMMDLHNGVQMPRFGLGTARMTDVEVVSRAVRKALESGYRLVDTSKNYDNEEAVGLGILQSGMSEAQIFLTTKLEEEDYGKDGVPRGFQGSLQRLKLNTVDLYLIHSPEYGKKERQETWQAMLELLHGAQCRAVGVSNYEISHLEEINEMGLELPTVNQIELSPFNYQKQRRVVEFCNERQIRLMAYSPLGVGEALDDRRVVELAKRYNKTAAQLLLRWSLQHDFIVIPKSDNPQRIEENAQIFDFEISAEDMQAMDHWK